MAVNESRRRWLAGALSGAAALATARVWATPGAGAGGKFVLVFLRGACDWLSVLVPYAEPFYYEARPRISIPAPDAANPGAAIPLDSRWGLHPALRESLLPMWKAGQLGFVPFSGAGFLNRSHFQAQDLIELGQPVNGTIDYNSGFMNRLAAELARGGRSGAISFTPQLPLAFKGPVTVRNQAVKRIAAKGLEARHEELLLALYRDDPLREAVAEGLATRKDMARDMRAGEGDEAGRGAPPAQSFADEALRIGRLMRDRADYTLGFIEVGGWDTHLGQGASEGALANRLAALGSGLQALSQGLGAEWKNTTVAVISEFGRTFRENGARGTDHGHGSMVWLLGGEGGQGGISGAQAGLQPGDLHQGRDAPVLNDHRRLLGRQFGRVFGLGSEAISRIFPGAPA